MSRDDRIDAYIARAPEFARPILEHLRALAHDALPDADEAIKWGMPHFLVNGKNLAGMAAFKAHCTFVIHGDGRQGDAMGQFGKITSLADLPGDSELTAKLRDARARIEGTGTALKMDTRKPRPEIPVPDAFAQALRDAPAARATFDGFAPSHRRDYLEWITEAKTEATRDKRIVQSIEWLAQGKRRNWKYEKC
ncbi:MAG TPA: YdeI/OmpD-associated family protein [Novosphingobium sp.]|nr:YdeI/OmpD-associated family protein [Novosphingobium sp.]